MWLINKKGPKNTGRIFFDHENIDKINLLRIFHDPLVETASKNICLFWFSHCDLFFDKCNRIQNF